MFELIKTAAYVGTASMAGLLVFFTCVQQTYVQELRNRLILLECFCLAIAFFSPNILIYNVAAGLIVPIFASNRRLIAPVFMFALLTLPLPATKLAIGSLYLISMQAAISLTIGAACTALVRGSRDVSKRFVGPSICILAIFLVLAWPNVRATSATNAVRSLLETSLALLLPFYVIRRSVRDLSDVRLMFVGMLAVAAALSTLAMYEARSGWPLYRIVSDHFGVMLSGDANVKMRGGLLRSPGPFPEPLSFAFQLSILTLLGLTSRWMFRSSKLHYLMIGIFVVGMFAPQSRSAWLGLGCGMLIYAFVTGKIGTLAKIGVFVPLAGAVTYVVGLSVPLIGNMLGLNSAGVINKDYRQTLLERGWQEAQGHLFAGQNFDIVTSHLSDLYQGEGIIDFVNTYLFVLLLSGVIGLIPFVLALLTPIGSLWNVRSRYREKGLSELAFVGGAFGAITMMLSFTSFIGRSTVTFAALMAVAATLVQMRPARRRSAVAERETVVLGASVRTPKATLIDKPVAASAS